MNLKFRGKVPFGPFHTPHCHVYKVFEVIENEEEKRKMSENSALKHFCLLKVKENTDTQKRYCSLIW